MSALTTSARGSTTDDVTNTLREAILDGSFAPGAWLREIDVAQSLNVSRTPVREALRRLADEHLVERSANRGCQVRSMTLEEAIAVYAVREALEGLAARCVAAKATDGLITELRTLHEQMDDASRSPADLATLNLAFHRALRDATDNAYLHRFLTQVEHAVRRLGTSSFADDRRVAQINDEHGRIIEAIERRDSDGAERAAAEHMRRARDARIRHMLEAL
jgi:DNA-binding GntR family transcriptional regulator